MTEAEFVDGALANSVNSELLVRLGSLRLPGCYLTAGCLFQPIWNRKSGQRDPTLVRHLYDLHVIREHYDATEVVALAREIMQADADTYGHQFPAYRDNPLEETLRAVAGIAADPGFALGYTMFLRDMVSPFATMRARSTPPSTALSALAQTNFWMCGWSDGLKPTSRRPWVPGGSPGIKFGVAPDHDCLRREGRG